MRFSRGLVVLVVALWAPVSATAAPSFAVLPARAAAVTYQFAMTPPMAIDAEGNGGTISLHRGADGTTVTITVTTPGRAPVSYRGSVAGDGTISVGAVRQWLTALNEVIAISREANSAAPAGRLWSSSTILRDRAGETAVQVPLKVLVVSNKSAADGRDVQLVAAGGLHSAVHETTSITTPRVSLYMRVAGHFIGGTLQDAAGTLEGALVNGAADVRPDASREAMAQVPTGAARSGELVWTLKLVPSLSQ